MIPARMRIGTPTGPGLARPLLLSAAVHLFALAGVLLLPGSAAGPGGAGLRVAAVDLVPGSDGGSGSAVAPRPSGLPSAGSVGGGAAGGGRRDAVRPSRTEDEVWPIPVPAGKDRRAPFRIDDRPAPFAAVAAARAELPGVVEAAAPPALRTADDSGPPGQVLVRPSASPGAAPASPVVPSGSEATAGASSGGHGEGRPGSPSRAGTASSAGWAPRPPEGGSGGGPEGTALLLRDRIRSRISYPDEAVRRGQEGEVLLRIRVGKGGIPGEIRVARSSGVRILDEAARRGVVRAAPLPSDPGWVEVPVRFVLH